MDRNSSAPPGRGRGYRRPRQVGGCRRTGFSRAIAALIVLAGLGLYGRYYWTTGRYMVSTDDATVAADSVIISPKVSGYLVDVPVEDNQAVHAGQVLARIDDRDYRTALAGARANVDAAQAAIENLEQKIAQQRLAVVAAQAAVATDQAALTFSQQQSGRYASLAHIGAGTTQELQQWQADIREKEAALAHDTAEVGVAAEADRYFWLRTRPRRRPRWRSDRRCSTRPNSISATRSLRHRRTARSGTARCASGSTCRPAPR